MLQLASFPVWFFGLASALHCKQAIRDSFVLDAANNRLLKDGEFFCDLDQIVAVKLQTQIAPAGNRRLGIVLSRRDGNDLFVAKTPLMPSLNKQPRYRFETMAEGSQCGRQWHDYQGQQTGFSPKDTPIFSDADQIAGFLKAA